MDSGATRRSAHAAPRLTITLPDAGRLAPTTYRRLMAASTLPFALLGHDGRFAEANRAFADLLGTTIARLPELSLLDVTHPGDDDLVESVLAPLLDAVETSGTATLRLVSYLGESIPVRTHLSAAGPAGAIHVLLAAVDLRPHRDRLGRLAYAATHDPLTGLLNRAGLLAQLDLLLDEGRNASVALLDLDGLKPINDAFGQATGDRLLQQIGVALHDIVRPDGLASRLAGDEFVVIADTDDELALGHFLAEELRHLEVEVAPGLVVTPTASIGTSPVRSGLTPSQVLAQADESMYAVKRRRQEAMSTPS
jgi:diguanylate cyclase (GGDEF)-like protein/PAS domain S-box-containing protein